VDHFHLVALANDAVTTVRRRVTWELKDRRGGKIDPEWANRRRLLTARERLSKKNFAKMWNMISDEDPSAQILSAYIAKEELRTVLSTVSCGGDPHRTRHRLHLILSSCIDSKIPELVTLARTVDAAATPVLLPRSNTTTPPRPNDQTMSTEEAAKMSARSAERNPQPCPYTG